FMYREYLDYKLPRNLMALYKPGAGDSKSFWQKIAPIRIYALEKRYVNPNWYKIMYAIDPPKDE
ncbi:MAG: hypothetical protein AB1478_12730, partial [Nitrospirota bacterium]